MLLTSNLQKNDNTLSFNENEVLRFIDNEQYLEAYTLLKSKSDKHISDIYNLALCCCMTQLYDACLQYLSDIPQGDLKKLMMKPKNNADNIQQKIETFQAQHLLSFTKGISSNYCNTFPQLVTDSIFRLKVNCFVALKQWENIINSIDISMMSKYKDVSDALMLAKENINK